METTQDKIDKLFKETNPEEATKALIAFLEDETAKIKVLYEKYGKEVVDRIMFLQGEYADVVEPYIEKYGLPIMETESRRKSPIPKPIIDFMTFVRGKIKWLKI